MTGESIFSFTEFLAEVTVVAVEVGEVLGLQVEAGDGQVETGLATNCAVVGSARVVSHHLGSQAFL